MEKRKIIYSGRWSRGYVCDGIFIKELVYYDPNSVKREMEASNAAFDSGIPTPKCFRYFDDGIHIQMYFQLISKPNPDILLTAISKIQAQAKILNECLTLKMSILYNIDILMIRVNIAKNIPVCLLKH